MIKRQKVSNNLNISYKGYGSILPQQRGFSLNCWWFMSTNGNYIDYWNQKLVTTKWMENWTTKQLINEIK